MNLKSVPDKYGSLFQYAVQELGDSEDQAHRRISAMRLLKELPEIEEKITSGALTLSNLGMAKSLFAKEKKSGKAYSRQQKLEVLQSLEKKPAREAARIVAAISPEALQHDRIRSLSKDKIEIAMTAPVEVQAKLEELKGLLAHSYPDISNGDLLNKLCDLGLQIWSKTATSRDLSRQKPQSQAGVRRSVFKRDKRCTNCGALYAMETDHIVPRAMGGSSEPENLRLLCRKCNQRAAIEKFGVEKMETFLKSPVVTYAVRQTKTSGQTACPRIMIRDLSPLYVNLIPKTAEIATCVYQTN